MNRANDIGALVINRIPLELFPVEFQDLSGVVISFIDCFILDGLLALVSDKRAWQAKPIGGMVGIVDGITWFFVGLCWMNEALCSFFYCC